MAKGGMLDKWGHAWQRWRAWLGGMHGKGACVTKGGYVHGEGV